MLGLGLGMPSGARRFQSWTQGAGYLWVGLGLLRANGGWGADLENLTGRSVGHAVVRSNRAWSAEIGSGALVSNVRERHLDGYTLVPIEFTLSHSFGPGLWKEPSDRVFQALPEALFRAYHTVVAHGIESRLDGISAGVRVNFTVPGMQFTPFGEASVGFAFADSHQVTVDGRNYGLGQDFNFNFTAALGVRYDFNERWFARLTVAYSHYSNGGLSEPEHENRQIDAVGPLLTVGLKF